MKYTYLGRSGLEISRLVLGTLNFGPEASEEQSWAIMDRAHELGINFFDTSNVYGWRRGEGWTEQIIGRWIAQGGGRRERTVLATKIYNPMSDWPNDRGLSARHIRQACDAALQRLQTDHVDILQMHHVDRNTPWDEIWEAMDVLRSQGKITYIGSSNFAGWHIAQGQEAALQRKRLGLVSEQSIYNLLTRDIELEVLPAAQNYGLGLLAWSPLHRGLLAGALRAERESGAPLAGGRYPTEAIENLRPQLQAWEDFCDEMGEHPAHVAIAWLLTRPGVAAPVTGPVSVEQLEQLVRAFEIHLDVDALKRIDDIFPGLKTAPEQYAF